METPLQVHQLSATLNLNVVLLSGCCCGVEKCLPGTAHDLKTTPAFEIDRIKKIKNYAVNFCVVSFYFTSRNYSYDITELWCINFPAVY